MLYASIGLKLLVQGSGSQAYMIGMLNALQLVIHLPLMKVNIPSNVGFFFRLILPIVMFDLLEDNNPFATWFEFDED